MQGDDMVCEQGDMDRRFRVLKHLLTVGATPLFPDRGSRAYRVYQMIVAVSAYLTLVTTFIGIINNLDDVGFVMEAARPGFPMINVLWTHFFIRYPTCGNSTTSAGITPSLTTSGFADIRPLQEMNA
jgi:hypothetical protein